VTTHTRVAGVDRAAQRVLAIAVSETLRPLFLRWATHKSRQYYEQTLESLWSAGGATLDAASVLSAIERLPEADRQYDDSSEREYYVMLSLGVLHCTIRVLAGRKLDASVEELDSLSEAVSKLLEVGDLLTQLGLAARRLGVDLALEREERTHGWAAAQAQESKKWN
jgi:hypothetical protein